MSSFDSICKMAKEYNIMVSGSAHSLYPMDTYYGLLWYNNDEAIEIPKRYPYKGEWGGCLSTCIMLRDKYPMPCKLSVVWLSLVEQKFYAIEEKLPARALAELWDRHSHYNYSHIIVGMAPYGNIALWFYGERKSTLLAWMYGTEVSIDMGDFLPENPSKSLVEYCDSYVKSDLRVKENLVRNGIPPHDLFDNYMKQFTYRYLLMFEQWNDNKREWLKYEEDELAPELDYIEEALFDGTHDKLHDGELMNYHQAGKPKKLAMKWHIKKSEYTAYFWFGEDEIQTLFDRFYGAHPETKTDFMIRIDSEKKKIELALYRYGLKEPQVISESAYQLLAFKNKFEYYRSDNYNQAKGAWIW